MKTIKQLTAAILLTMASLTTVHASESVTVSQLIANDFKIMGYGHGNVFFSSVVLQSGPTAYLCVLNVHAETNYFASTKNCKEIK